MRSFILAAGCYCLIGVKETMNGEAALQPSSVHAAQGWVSLQNRMPLPALHATASALLPLAPLSALLLATQLPPTLF